MLNKNEKKINPGVFTETPLAHSQILFAFSYYCMKVHWLHSCVQQEIWRRPKRESPPPPDLSHHSSVQDAPRWAFSRSPNHHVQKKPHNAFFYIFFLFVAHRHCTIRNPVKTCAVKHSHINWLPCYVCCLACGDTASPSGTQCLHHKSSFWDLVNIVVFVAGRQRFKF